MAADSWSQQVDELVALSSIYPDDFRLLSAPGLDADDLDNTSTDVLLEALYASPACAAASTSSGPPLTPTLSFELCVHVDVPPGGIQLQLRPDTPVVLTSSSTTAEKSVYACGGRKAQHLPPLTLTITLPPSYPTAAPPDACIRGVWLSEAQALRLQEHLLLQWEAQGPGQPVCFLWADWLREHTLRVFDVTPENPSLLLPTNPAASRTGSHTHAQSHPHLTEASGNGQQAGGTPEAPYSHTTNGTAARGASGAGACTHGATPSAFTASPPSHASPPPAVPQPSQSPQPSHAPAPPALLLQHLAASLLRYSAHKEEEAFRTAPCTCPVCFDDVLGSKCSRLPGCGHYCCRSCFSQYVRTQVADGAVEAIRCMDTSCRQPVPPALIQSMLTPEEYMRWETLLLQRTLDKMEDVVYCPRCFAASMEDADHCAQCPKCLYVFCGLCDESWHPGSQCLTPDQVLERKAERLERSGNMSVEERTRRRVDLMGQYRSLAVVMQSSKQCPVCRMAIQKTEGCNKMLCTNCNTKFCFKCLEVIEDYNHFGAGRCVLFDDHEIARWNAAMGNMGDRALEAAAMGMLVGEARRNGGAVQGARVQFSYCPTCGQANLRENGLNLMRCFFCTSAWCHLCRAVLRQKPGLHFGPSKCKQHSDT